MQQIKAEQNSTTQKEQTEKTVLFFTGGNLCTVTGQWEWELHSEALYCSDVMGWPEDFLGTKAIFYPDDKEDVIEALSVLQQGHNTHLEFRIITTYGEVKTISGTGLNIKPEGQEPPPPLSAALQQKETDALMALHELAVNVQQKTSYNYGERILNTGVWYVNSVTGDTWYSDQVFRIYGFAPQTFNAHAYTFLPFIHPDQANEVREAIEAAHVKLSPLHIEFRIVRPGGDVRWVQQSTTWNFNDKGEPLLHGLLQDITEQKETDRRCENDEMAISFQKQLLHFTELAANIGYWQVNVLTKKVTYSDNHFRIFGLKPQSVSAGTATFTNYIHPDDRAIYEEVQRKMRKEHAAPEIDYRIIRADGKTRYLRQKAKAIISGSEVLVVGTIQDISVQKTLEKRLGEAKESEQVKSFAAQQTEVMAGVGTWRWNVATDDMEWSDNFYELLGLKPGTVNLSQKLLLRNIHPDDQKIFNDALAVTLHENMPSVFAFRLISKGQVRYMKASFRMLPFEGANYFIATVQDITLEHSVTRELKQRILLIEMLADTLPAQVMVTDTDNNFVLWNKECESIYKKRREKVIGQNFFDIFPELKNEMMVSRFSKVLAGEEVKVMNHRGAFVLKGIFNMTHVPIMGERGDVDGALHLVQDVTVQHEINEQLANRLRFIEKLLEVSVDRIVVLDQNLNFLYWNKRAEAFYGISKSEVIGKNILEIFPEAIGQPSYAPMRKALRGEAVYLPAEMSDNNPVSFETWLLPVANDKGIVEAVLWVVHDLTKEFTLNKEQKRAEQILNTIHEACLELDSDNRIIYINNKAAKLWNKGKEELLQKNFWQAFPSLVDSTIHFAIQYALDEKAFVQREVFSSLSNRWYNLVITPTEAGVIILFFDIHEIKEARQQLESEHRLMLEAQAIGHIGSFEWRVGEGHSRWSDELYRINGMEPQSETITLETVDRLIHPNDWKGLQKVRQQAIETPGFYQHVHRVITQTGAVKWVNHQFESIAGEEGNVVSICGVLQDITHLKKTEEALLLREEQLLQRTHYAEAIIDASIDQITVFDTEERFIAWNKRSEEVSGVKRGEVIGKKIEEVFPASHIDAEFREAHARALNGEYVFIAAKKGVFAKGYHEWFYIPLKDHAGHLYAVLNVIHDVSEKVETESKLTAMNTELEVKNHLLEARNDEIANFAFIASHDLKEPLRKIHTFSNWIVEREAAHLTEKGQEYITKLMSAVKRLDTLIEDVTALMQITTSKENFKPVAIAEVFLEAEKNLAESITGSKAVIETRFLPVVNGHQKQLSYLFVNLLSNAIKFQQPEVIPVIEIKGGHYKNEEGLDFISITFIDNGIGFEQQYAAKIFDIFQRLHGQSTYPGTGIGLSICKKIMENHGGYILVKSSPGKGSTFTCYFPA